MNITKELKGLKLDLSLLESHCLQTEAGLEAIDPKIFLSQLQKLTSNSTKLVKYILSTRDVTIKYIPSVTFNLNKQVLKTPYATSARNVLFIPISFVGHISTFAEFLTSYKTMMLTTNQALVDANKVFSEYIVEPKNLSKLDPKRVPSLEKVKSLPKEFGEFFTGKDGNDRAVMEEIYQSYSNFNLASETISKLTETFNNVKLSDIKKNIDSFYETLSLINSKLVSGETMISKPTAKAIGGLIYNIADWVSLYSLYLTKLNALSIAHHDNTKKLNSFF